MDTDQSSTPGIVRQPSHISTQGSLNSAGRAESIQMRSSSVLSGPLSSSPGIGSSYQRVNHVTEAQSVLPSFTSAFSLEVFENIGSLQLDNGNFVGHMQMVAQQASDVIQSQPDLPTTADDEEQFQLDDIFENPAYTDTVRSTDSTASMLRRSVSVPPQYHFKNQRERRIPDARDVFQNYPRGDAVDVINEDDVSTPVSRSVLSSSHKTRQEWQQTVAEILERSDNIDSLQSNSSGAGLLAKTAIAFSRDGRRTFTKVLTKDENALQAQYHGKPYKNLLVLSVSFMFSFMSYISLRNLQTSINSEGGLAMLSLSTVYAFLLIGCVFAPTIVQRYRPKMTIIMCQICFIIYVASNFYPHFYTLLPMSAVTGFALSNIWTAHATYLTNCAASYAEKTGKPLIAVLGMFNGTFFMCFGIAQVIGGTIASLTFLLGDRDPSSEYLHYGNNSLALTTTDSPSNLTVTGLRSPINITDNPPHGACGAEYCNSRGDSSSLDIDAHVRYLLLSIYAVCSVIGLLLTVILLDPLEGILRKSHATLCAQLTSVFRWFYDIRVLCLAGIISFTLIGMSFLFGEFTKAYVTCPYGVKLVGFAMVAANGASSISAFATGKLNRWLKRYQILLLAAMINLMVLLTLRLWVPTPDTMWVMFTLSSFWGVADGIWVTQVISLIGIVFSTNREPAFAGLKMCQSLGACINLLAAEYMCTYIKIYTLSGVLIFSMTTYLILEWRLPHLGQDVNQRNVIQLKRTKK